ncbi:MAG: hypothetical protein ACR2NL_09400, partial [Acidimicrobiia bacterium]
MSRIHFTAQSTSSGGGAVNSVSGSSPIVITGTAADPVVTLPSLSGSLLDANSVTVGKLQTIATNRILGRTTAATGDVEILTAAQVVGIIVDEGADGPGSGLDADTLDGQHATDFVELTDSIDVLADVDTTTSTPSVGEHLEWDGSNWVPGTAGGGVTDHGALTGLADDDHTQYLLIDGTRAMTGALDMDGNNITNARYLFTTEGDIGAEVVPVASAVNYVRLGGAIAAGSGPYVLAGGTDTDIDLRLQAKNAGVVRIISGLQLDSAMTSNIDMDTNFIVDARMNSGSTWERGEILLENTAGTTAGQLGYSASADLIYMGDGTNARTFVPTYASAADPTANDDSAGNGVGGRRFFAGSLWVNTTTDTVFVSVDSSATAAIWLRVADEADVLLLDGTQAMTGDLDMGNNDITDLNDVFADALGLDFKQSTGEHIVRGQGVVSAVNYLQIRNSIATVSPDIAAIGTDTDIDIQLIPKNAGVVDIDGDIQLNSNDILGISDIRGTANSNARHIFFSDDTTPVNYLTIENADTTIAPRISSAGSDTHIDLRLLAKNDGVVSIEGSDLDLNGNDLLNPGTGHDAFTDFVASEHVDSSLLFVLASNDTDDITEGATNLFYTDARVGTYLLGRPVETTLDATDEFVFNESSATPSLITYASLLNELEADLDFPGGGGVLSNTWKFSTSTDTTVD